MRPWKEGPWIAHISRKPPPPAYCSVFCCSHLAILFLLMLVETHTLNWLTQTRGCWRGIQQ
jgi:hypothetical protein